MRFPWTETCDSKQVPSPEEWESRKVQQDERRALTISRRRTPAYLGYIRSTNDVSDQFSSPLTHRCVPIQPGTVEILASTYTILIPAGALFELIRQLITCHIPYAPFVKTGPLERKGRLAAAQRRYKEDRDKCLRETPVLKINKVVFADRQPLL